ncbi:hypothetical protein [uncultured Erythrobacter sp.]|uniref:hypothetical protein n=1 Tax=uncultured Erythrobacter sp. TaxID=263913 RepID=UPI0026060EB4|nr:hypothetical protein [uncultured Erythrobacter sp.]
MGGFGSGRRFGDPVAEEALRIDIAWMVRTKRAVPGSEVWGSLSWTCGGEPSGNINYTCDMTDLENAILELRFKVTRRSTGQSTDHVQCIQLSYTEPNFGGKRWWMHCPRMGERVGKLYCPAGAELFASRKAYSIGYRSQRITRRDAVFERLFRIQKKLGCEEGWGNWITRPKGMHHRTFERYLDEYEYLDGLCAVEMMQVIGILQAMEKR